MSGVQILGALFAVGALCWWFGYAFGVAREQERWAMRALRRQRDDPKIRVTIGGYEAGPRLVSELRRPGEL